MQVEAGDTSPFSLVLYLIAIACFTISAWPLPPAAFDLPQTRTTASIPTATRRVWIMLGAGIALAIIVHVITLFLLKADINSVAGGWLWLASMVLLLATTVLVGKSFGWPPRWGGQLWPSTRLLRWLLIGVIIVIIIAAAAARLLSLDTVPLGLNADEGDRGALSIQIVRGFNTDSIFSAGWYYISMLYFWLMAAVMKVFGIGFVQTRMFSAIAGIVAVGAVTWIGIRHFSWRVGVMAGALLALLAVALQFSRVTSESGPTAALWAISVALFMEVARTGRLWAWAGAGVWGGLSIYFYPTGRLWVVVAIGFCLYLLIHGLGGRRQAILGGSIVSALAALMAVSPFLVNALNNPDTLGLRAAQTSIFNSENLSRLDYYQPDWSSLRLLEEQVSRSVGIFNQFADPGFWSTGQPLMSGALAVLTLIGLGWVSVRLRDPRFVLLSLWFWVGFVGVIVTVETPNLQRMATAVPVIAFFPALVLDSIIRRVEALGQGVNLRWARAIPLTATAAALVLVALLMAEQGRYYFATYGVMDRWPWPTREGQAVAEQGTNTLVVGVGRQAHQANAGWVRLLAPNTPHGAVFSPGAYLPLGLPPQHDLAFFVFTDQSYYLPYIHELYPIGSSKVYTHPTEGEMFTIYRIPQAEWAASEGAVVTPPQGTAQHVDALGQAPRGWNKYPAAMRWTAGLSVPKYWNYALQIGPGPAQLSIDGMKVLTVPNGTASMSTTLSLARGIHAISYAGTLTNADNPALFQWASVPQVDPDQPAPELDWQSPAAENLMPTQVAAQGLYGVMQIAGMPEQHRLVRTLATSSLSDEIGAAGNPYTTTFTATLTAPTTGVYSMTIFSQGLFDLKLDGQLVAHNDKPDDSWTGASVPLSAGTHTVSLVYLVMVGPGGFEWVWTPPGGERSIVSPAVFSPSPTSAGVGPPLDATTLGSSEQQPSDDPINTIP
ncbi:MAG: hypothetical protein DLM69_06545 [Candidatus Chloroheliales bacterium]|nr:MAG: hypothetical protein DLM69_06545 [Chloroflexota bacterium]